MLWPSGAHLHHGNSLIVPTARSKIPRRQQKAANDVPRKKGARSKGSLDGGSLASLSGKNLALDVLAPVANLFYSLLHRCSRFSGLARFVADLIILPACHPSLILLTPSAGLLL
jgi:hypothetical protein